MAAKNQLSMMPWFPGDFLASTRGWSITATGVYRALLDAQWDLGILPESTQNLRKIIAATNREWSEGWKLCENKFPLKNGGRQNERLEAHRAKSLGISEKRRETGRKGGLASARANAEPIAKANGVASAEANGAAEVNHLYLSLSEEKIKTPAERASEPDVPVDPDDPDDYLIWTAGVDLLGQSKRGLIGKLVKDHGRELVARKLGELMAMTEKPRDPAGYLVGAMRKLKRGVVV